MIVLQSSYRRLEQSKLELRGTLDVKLSELAQLQIRVAVLEAVIAAKDETLSMLRDDLTRSEHDRRELALRQPMTPASKFLFNDDPFAEEPLREKEEHSYLSPSGGEVPDMQDVLAALDQPRETPEITS